MTYDPQRHMRDHVISAINDKTRQEFEAMYDQCQPVIRQIRKAGTLIDGQIILNKLLLQEKAEIAAAVYLQLMSEKLLLEGKIKGHHATDVFEYAGLERLSADKWDLYSPNESLFSEKQRKIILAVCLVALTFLAVKIGTLDRDQSLVSARENCEIDVKLKALHDRTPVDFTALEQCAEATK